MKLKLNWTFWYFYCSKQIYSHQRVSQQNLIIRSFTFVAVRVQHNVHFQSLKMISWKSIDYRIWVYRWIQRKVDIWPEIDRKWPENDMGLRLSSSKVNDDHLIKLSRFCIFSLIHIGRILVLWSIVQSTVDLMRVEASEKISYQQATVITGYSKAEFLAMK